ncbi:hypothetical protein OAD00_03785 [Saprospiraceae bacterium]|nr:hypothetical protein [Saprospiraceae bacterium]MDB9914958.1 hypothetical protein [Saprospiraceae bacterium]
MKSIIQILFIALIGLISSCSQSLNYYTQTMHDDYRLSETELQSVQFYLSKDIVLYRNLGINESKIFEGKIKIVDGRKVEEIIFPKETPGVLMFTPKQDRFAISFEEQEDSFLMFGPNKKAGGKFVLLAKEWGRRIGKVTYKGKIYNTHSQSVMAALLVDIDKAKKVSRKTKKIKGRKI